MESILRDEGHGIDMRVREYHEDPGEHEAERRGRAPAQRCACRSDGGKASDPIPDVAFDVPLYMPTQGRCGLDRNGPGITMQQRLFGRHSE